MKLKIDWNILVILLIGLFSRLSPIFISGFIDPDSYYHLRIITAFDSLGRAISYDQLSFGGRPYTYYPLYHLSGLNLFSLWKIGNFGAYSILSIIASLIAILATYSLALKIVQLSYTGSKDFELAKKYVPYFSSLLVAISPIALSRSMVFGRPDAFVLCFAPLIVLSFLNNQIFDAFLLFVLLSLFHFPASLVLFVTLIIIGFSSYLVKSNFNFKVLGSSFLGLLAGSIYYLRFNVFDYFSPAIFSSSELAVFSWKFIFFYVATTLLFTMVFLYFAFKNDFYKKVSFLLFWFSVSFALVLLGERNIVFLAIPICICAGFGILLIISNLKFTSNIMLIAIWIFFAISSLAYASTIFQSTPSSDYSAALFLSNSLSGKSSMSMSSWEYGHMISYLSNRPVFIDGYFEFSNNATGRINLVNSIFSNSANSLDDIYGYGVNYIFQPSSVFSFNPSNISTNLSISKIYDSGTSIYYIQKQFN